MARMTSSNEMARVVCHANTCAKESRRNHQKPATHPNRTDIPRLTGTSGLHARVAMGADQATQGATPVHKLANANTRDDNIATPSPASLPATPSRTQTSIVGDRRRSKAQHYEYARTYDCMTSDASVGNAPGSSIIQMPQQRRSMPPHTTEAWAALPSRNCARKGKLNAPLAKRPHGTT